MSYFKDLELGCYHGGLFDPASWACPLRYVGWLENGKPFERGQVPDWVVPRIHKFRNHSKLLRFSIFRGYHRCSFCAADGQREPLAESYLNIFVPGDSEVFVVPGRIDHYITTHGYRPPDRFLSALENSPIPGSDDYVTALTKSNGGAELSGGFHRNQSRDYLERSAAPFSAEVLDAERRRLEQLGCGRAMPPERFAALLTRLEEQAADHVEPRSYTLGLRHGEEYTPLRVQARAPFEARFVAAQEFPTAQISSPSDELGVRPNFDEQGNIVTNESVYLEPLPHCEAIADAALNLLLEERYGRMRRNQQYFDDLRSRMHWENDEANPTMNYTGEIALNGESVPICTDARSQAAADMAAVARFGADRRFRLRSPKDVENRPRFEPSLKDVVVIDQLPYSPSLVDDAIHEQQRRSSTVRGERQVDAKRRSFHRMYREDKECQEYTSHVVIGRQQLWVSVQARILVEAQIAVRRAFPDAHTIKVKRVRPN